MYEKELSDERLRVFYKKVRAVQYESVLVKIDVSLMSLVRFGLQMTEEDVQATADAAMCFITGYLRARLTEDVLKKYRWVR